MKKLFFIRAASYLVALVFIVWLAIQLTNGFQAYGFQAYDHGQQTDAAQMSKARYQAIQQLLQNQKYEEAFDACRELIQQAPNYELAYVRLTEIATRAKLLPTAFAFLNDLKPATAQVRAYQHFALAALYSFKEAPSQADHQQTIFHCNQSLAADANFIRCYPLLIEATLALKQAPVTALEVQLKALVTQAPKNAAAHFALGYLYKLTRRYAEGIQAFEQTLQQNPKLFDARYEKIATLFRSQSPEARQFGLAQTKEYWEQVSVEANSEQSIKALRLLGYAYGFNEQWRNSLQAYQRALTLAETHGELAAQSYILTSLGNALAQVSDYGKMVQACQQAIALPFARNREYNLSNLGFAYRQLGKTAEGIKAYEEALALAHQTNNTGALLSVLINLGEAYADNEVKRYAESKRLLTEAYELAVKTNNRIDQARALASLGVLAFRQKHYQEALRQQLQALELAQSIKLLDQVARSLNSLGLVYDATRQWDKAIAAHQQAKQIGQELGTSRLIWTAHGGLARIYQQRGENQRAQEELRLAIQQLEATRPKIKAGEDRISFWRDKVKLYKDLIALLLSANSPAIALRAVPETNKSEAFHFAERARARALLDLLTEADNQAGVPEATAQRTTSLTAETGQPIQFSEAQAYLDEKTAILSYSLGEKASFLFLIEKQRFTVYRLPNEDTINLHAKQLREALADPYQTARAASQLKAQALYRMLIQPAQAQLAGKTHLIIAADGVLQQFPFAVLRKPISANPARLESAPPYLLKDFAFSYTPSVSTWVSLKKKAVQPKHFPKELLAFGDPVYGSPSSSLTSNARSLATLSLPALPYSRAEANKIASFFQPSQVNLFLGTEANEQNAKTTTQSAQYRIIHFSVHAAANENIPGYSALFLSPPTQSSLTTGNDEDGMLTANEIFKLHLTTELVVLSACETGLGKEVKGEGIMGLARAFIHAGAPSVMMSLWKVDDRATAELMENFYRYYLKGKEINGQWQRLSQAQALQEAQREALKKSGDAYYWGAFILAST